MKPLEEPPEWEGDDSINTPPGGTDIVTEADLEDTVELDDEDDDDE